MVPLPENDPVLLDTVDNSTASSTAISPPGETPVARPRLDTPTLVTAAVVVSLLGSLYVYLAYDLMEVWNHDPNYEHGWFVLGASVLFAYMAWSNAGLPLRDHVEKSLWVSGAVQVAFGLVVHLVCWLAKALLVDTVSLIFVLRGLLKMGGGEEVNRAYGFSVLFLVFMAPLPAKWYNDLALVMQSAAAITSTKGLELLEIPARREGYKIFLDNPNDPFNKAPIPVEVGAACSGLRQLTAVIALAVAVGHLSGRGLRYKLILALCALPVAVASNCLRVFFTALILLYFGPEWAQGRAHEHQGLVMVGLSSLIIMGLAWVLAASEDAGITGAKPENTAAPAAKAAGPSTAVST